MMTPRGSLATVLTVVAVVGSTCHDAAATIVQPEAFVDPMVFDFSDLPTATRLGEGLANPFADLGVEFTGFVTSFDHDDIVGNHLATGFANSPPEPFVVRVRMLDKPALRIGGFVWGEIGVDTTVSAYDDDGNLLESFSVFGSGETPFMGLESEVPIRYLEWTGGLGADLSTFPRVDGIMINIVPEPTSLALLGLGGLAIVQRRMKSRTAWRALPNRTSV